MNTEKARKTVWELSEKSVMTPEEQFIYTESLEYLIQETGDTEWMVTLGGYYYGLKEYDLALKYYEMADECGDRWAAEGLGYIWYYGRTGEKDYEKAFRYYSKAADNGNLKSKIKVADMYKNGYYVDRDYDMYCNIIEEAEREVAAARYVFDPVPEVYTRLARIRKQQGRTDEAVELYLKTKWFMRQRIRYSQFFGDLNIMKWTVEDLYTMIPFDEAAFDLYDLYWLFREPVRVTFRYEGKKYEVESSRDEETMAIRFGDRWFRTADDFFNKAVIDGELLTVLYRDLYGFEVMH